MYKSYGLTGYLLVAERRARPFSLTAVSKRLRLVMLLTHAAADHVISAREQGCLMWRRSRDLIPQHYRLARIYGGTGVILFLSRGNAIISRGNAIISQENAIIIRRGRDIIALISRSLGL